MKEVLNLMKLLEESGRGEIEYSTSACYGVGSIATVAELADEKGEMMHDPIFPDNEMEAGIRRTPKDIPQP